MDKLKKYPPHKIGVSIYGASPETYEKVCGNAAAFGKMLAGGKMLSTLPSILEFRTTLIEDNYRDLSDIGLLVKENFGKTYEVTVSSEVYQPVRGACGDVSTCRLSPEKMWQICIGKIYESAKEENRFNTLFGHIPCNMWNPGSGQCIRGRRADAGQECGDHGAVTDAERNQFCRKYHFFME